MCLAQGPQRSDASEDQTRGPSVSSQTLYHCAPIKNSKTIWILVRSLWLFSQTPCIHVGIPRGSKLIIFIISNFCHSKILHALIQRGARGPDTPPLEKTQVIWDSIGNKQLDPPTPGKSWTPAQPPPTPAPRKKCLSPSGTSNNYNFL